MRKLRILDLSITGMVERFYLMMVFAIVLSLLGQFILAATLAYTLAVSFILGVSYRRIPVKSMSKEHGRVSDMKGEKSLQEAA
ncbi:MAG: hypothetical protein HKN76_10835 [Saprospiraceae bacterium]|nr:hypothetical protein [Saprospiraceae bacterium]